MRFTLITFLSLLTVARLMAEQPIPWKAPTVSLAFQETDINDALQAFAAAESIPLTVAQNLHGVVSGSFTDADPIKVLDALTASNGLVWFFDGARLYVESLNDVQSKALSVSTLSATELIEAADAIGWASGPVGDQFQIRATKLPNLIAAVGSPKFISEIDQLSHDLDAQKSAKLGEQLVVRMFKLSYASAQDVTVSSGQNTTTLPGVARVLQNLMNVNNGGQLSTGPLRTTAPNTVPGMAGSGYTPDNSAARTNQYNSANEEALQPRTQRAPASNDNTQDERKPTIQVDTRLNAVIVLDKASRMPMYEQLIRMLDVPTQVIEIQAAIVDVDMTHSSDIGFALLGSINSGNTVSRFGFNADPTFDPVNNNITPSFVDGANLVRGAGLNASLLITEGAVQILSRIRLQQNKGATQIVSTPAVLTMDNVEAVIDQEQTVYVRVQGYQDVNLFNVTAGTTLRVTPTLVDEKGRRSYRLLVQIQDGSFEATQVDQIPTKDQATLTTQAIVPDNRTLLLGGYNVIQKTANKSSVPYLDRIPILGHIFSEKTKSTNSTRRFFFITPRLVEINEAARTQRGGKQTEPYGRYGEHPESPYSQRGMYVPNNTRASQQKARELQQEQRYGH
jgi:type III secretion protein C